MCIHCCAVNYERVAGLQLALIIPQCFIVILLPLNDNLQKVNFTTSEVDCQTKSCCPALCCVSNLIVEIKSSKSYHE